MLGELRVLRRPRGLRERSRPGRRRIEWVTSKLGRPYDPVTSGPVRRRLDNYPEPERSAGRSRPSLRRWGPGGPRLSMRRCHADGDASGDPGPLEGSAESHWAHHEALAFVEPPMTRPKTTRTLPDPLLSINELADYWGCSPDTVIEMIRSGDLPPSGSDPRWSASGSPTPTLSSGPVHVADARRGAGLVNGDRHVVGPRTPAKPWTSTSSGSSGTRAGPPTSRSPGSPPCSGSPATGAVTAMPERGAADKVIDALRAHGCRVIEGHVTTARAQCRRTTIGHPR